MRNVEGFGYDAGMERSTAILALIAILLGFSVVGGTLVKYMPPIEDTRTLEEKHRDLIRL